uniref:Uncharacterized protein n=1 Tax=Trypanosoma congolense (strain IL3000) TaxID=1068625 RepID=G0UXX7_TRYCI|nr:conserved hypothetical protein [Trypanosoma congolense IL3000]
MSCITISGFVIRLHSDFHNTFNPVYAFGASNGDGTVGLLDIGTNKLHVPYDAEGNIVVTPGTSYRMVYVNSRDFNQEVVPKGLKQDNKAADIGPAPRWIAGIPATASGEKKLSANVSKDRHPEVPTKKRKRSDPTPTLPSDKPGRYSVGNRWDPISAEETGCDLDDIPLIYTLLSHISSNRKTLKQVTSADTETTLSLRTPKSKTPRNVQIVADNGKEGTLDSVISVGDSGSAEPTGRVQS